MNRATKDIRIHFQTPTFIISESIIKSLGAATCPFIKSLYWERAWRSLRILIQKSLFYNKSHSYSISLSAILFAYNKNFEIIRRLYDGYILKLIYHLNLTALNTKKLAKIFVALIYQIYSESLKREILL